MPRLCEATEDAPRENTACSSVEAERLDQTHRHENAFPSAKGDFRKLKLIRTGHKIRAGFSRVWNRNSTKTEAGAPVWLRQLWQWHQYTAFGLPVATKRIAPHRQLPSCCSVVPLMILTFLILTRTCQYEMKRCGLLPEVVMRGSSPRHHDGIGELARRAIVHRVAAATVPYSTRLTAHPGSEE
jgi:hypothetical protein